MWHVASLAQVWRFEAPPANMSDDEYLREIVQEELDDLWGDSEIYEEFENEQEVFDPQYGPEVDKSEFTKHMRKRMHKRMCEESPWMGWTTTKRRCVQEKVKNFRDHRLMRGAIAATCKALYVANAKGSESEVKPAFGKRQLHFKDIPSNKVWVLVREWS